MRRHTLTAVISALVAISIGTMESRLPPARRAGRRAEPCRRRASARSAATGS